MRPDLAFTPVPVRPRRDGWTPARQGAFIAALAESRCVVAAARAAGPSWQSAYRLRDRPDAASFADAWDRALAPDLSAPPSGRAVDGIATPIRYRGQQVGERRRYDNRLAMYLLRLRRPERYGLTRDPDEVLYRALAALDADLMACTETLSKGEALRDVAGISSPSGHLAPLRSGRRHR